MNNINPRKLLNSKWTAVNPHRKEKHFVVTVVKFDEEGLVIDCKIEAVMTKKLYPIQWRDLMDEQNWQQGWK
jgi:tryptophan-rich hypothetical protein